MAIKPLVALSVRINPIELKQVDAIAAARNWTRSHTIQRMIEVAIQAPEFLSVREAQAAQVAAEQEEQSQAAQEAAQAAQEAHARKVRRYAKWKAFDPANWAVITRYPWREEAPHLRIFYTEFEAGYSHEQVALLKQGIEPWDPEWTAKMPKIGTEDGLAMKMGFDRNNQPQNLDAYIEGYRRLVAAGIDPFPT